MPIFEILLLIIIFGLSLWLLFINFETALSLLLILSVLLHKEFFSIYRWDLLPIRVFMLAFLTFSGLKVFHLFKVGITRDKVKEFFLQPFVFLVTIYWIVHGISIIFSENLVESVLFFGFITTVLVLGVVLYSRLKDKPKKVFNLIKTYIYILFGLSIFGYIQLAVYQTTGFIFGALWNVHGRLPRIGTTFWDVNHFAALLASVLPVLGVLILIAKTKKQKLIYSGMFVPMTLMLLITNSRSAWMLVAVSLLLFVIILLVRKWGTKSLVALLGIILLVFSLGALEFSNKASPFRKVIKDYMHYRIDSFDSHFLLLKGAYQVFEKFPYFGGGTGAFYEQFSKTDVAPIFFGRDPIFLTEGFRAPGHSVWGEALAETGAVGIFVFVLLLSFILFHLLYIALKEKNKEKYLISASMFAALSGWLFAGIFYSYKAEFFWIIFFLYFLYAYSLLKDKYSLDVIYSYFLKSNKLPFFVIAVLGAVLIFSNLGVNHFIPWDEAIYAKIAKNMVNTGNFIVQQWDLGSPWYEKPPLYMWLAAISMKIFGISEFAARFPSALLGYFTVFLVYIFGRRLFNKTAGFIAAIALLTTTQFLYYARASMLDVSVSFFMTLGLYIYYKTTLSFNKRNWVLLGVVIGLGAMIKNVVGFLPYIVIGINELYLIISGSRKINREVVFNYLAAIGASLLIFLPWHIDQLLRFGRGFVDSYIIYHIFTRGFSAIEQKGRPLWWYFIILRVSMRIWFVALLAAFPFTMFSSFVKKSSKHIFLIIWALVLFAFFTISKSKIVWYIVPMYPILALILGNFGDKAYDWFANKYESWKSSIRKGFALYLMTSLALFYLFLVRDLVYTGDLTGSQAMLLQRKDTEFGLEIPVHVDKVDLPLIKYYTDGVYVDIEFRPLKNKLDNALYDEQVVFITKESRFRKLAAQNVNITLVEKIEDHALAFMDSQFERDNNELLEVQAEIKDLERKASLLLDESNRLSILKGEEQFWLNAIEVGLFSVQERRQGQ